MPFIHSCLWLYILSTTFNLVEGEQNFCSKFSTCEKCAGRHKENYQQCVWCGSENACVNATDSCLSAHREIYDCPRLLEIAYDEPFVRNIVTPLIAAAQGNDSQIQDCVASIPGHAQLWRRYVTRSKEGERTDFYFAIDFEHRAIILSFHSVAGGHNLIYNHFSAEFYTNRQVIFEETDALVNRYIYDSWINSWYSVGVERGLRRLFSFYKGFDLWIFGHSIGGAKAEMTALKVVQMNMILPSKIRLVTFGGTRVGDLSFVELIETQIPYRFRIVHGRDMVVRYPRKYDGEWTPPHHRRYEVWYPQKMTRGSTFFVCLGAEDPQCSTRLPTWQLRADDNEVYFEKSMEDWAESGCQPDLKWNEDGVADYWFKDMDLKYNMSEIRPMRTFSTTPRPSNRLQTSTGIRTRTTSSESSESSEAEEDLPQKHTAASTAQSTSTTTIPNSSKTTFVPAFDKPVKKPATPKWRQQTEGIRLLKGFSTPSAMKAHHNTQSTLKTEPLATTSLPITAPPSLKEAVGLSLSPELLKAIFNDEFLYSKNISKDQSIRQDRSKNSVIKPNMALRRLKKPSSDVMSAPVVTTSLQKAPEHKSSAASIKHSTAIPKSRMPPTIVNTSKVPLPIQKKITHQPINRSSRNTADFFQNTNNRKLPLKSNPVISSTGASPKQLPLSTTRPLAEKKITFSTSKSTTITTAQPIRLVSSETGNVTSTVRSASLPSKRARARAVSTKPNVVTPVRVRKLSPLEKTSTTTRQKIFSKISFTAKLSKSSLPAPSPTAIKSVQRAATVNSQSSSARHVVKVRGVKKGADSAKIAPRQRVVKRGRRQNATSRRRARMTIRRALDTRTIRLHNSTIHSGEV